MDEIKNINVQFENWAVNHGLQQKLNDKQPNYLYIESQIGENNWRINLYKSGNQELDIGGLDPDSKKLTYSDITDKYGNLDENLAAEYVIYNINEFDPQMALDDFVDQGIETISRYTNSSFEDMLNQSKEFFDEKQLELEEEYNLAMELDFDSPSKKL